MSRAGATATYGCARARLRWCVAGLLRAESKFRRVKGHRGMGSLLKALERLVRGEPSGEARDVA